MKGVVEMERSKTPIKNELIREFIRLLQNTPDNVKEMSNVMAFLNTVLRYKESTPPTTEIITVLKHHKPIIFQMMRLSIPKSNPKYIILQLEMDYNTALERLNLNNEYMVS